MFEESIISRHSPGLLTCLICKETAAFRYLDCHHQSMLCRACCRKSHVLQPFHHIERWVSNPNQEHPGFFQRTALSSTGLCLYVGHSNGTIYSNPLNVPSENWTTRGIHFLPVKYCYCSNQTTDPLVQLLHLDLWPSTFKAPRTVFTQSLLQQYHSLNLETQVSSFKFYQFLRK
ncbi:hypothetical protein C8Q75DRAFT_727018 [Abortiporus biennis]|nr:hypothetical protein C8Q75DRAFT_727018 [Abortiporus biennis]